jgi:hypothetical protein
MYHDNIRNYLSSIAVAASVKFFCTVRMEPPSPGISSTGVMAISVKVKKIPVFLSFFRADPTDNKNRLTGELYNRKYIRTCIAFQFPCKMLAISQF